MKNENCRNDLHAFFEVKKVVSYKAGAAHVDKDGTRIVCGYCGEIRNIWEDGLIEVMKGAGIKEVETNETR